jgi:hypothetical protein
MNIDQADASAIAFSDHDGGEGAGGNDTKIPDSFESCKARP